MQKIYHNYQLVAKALHFFFNLLLPSYSGLAVIFIYSGVLFFIGNALYIQSIGSGIGSYGEIFFVTTLLVMSGNYHFFRKQSYMKNIIGIVIMLKVLFLNAFCIYLYAFEYNIVLTDYVNFYLVINFVLIILFIGNSKWGRMHAGLPALPEDGEVGAGRLTQASVVRTVISDAKLNCSIHKVNFTHKRFYSTNSRGGGNNSVNSKSSSNNTNKNSYNSVGEIGYFKRFINIVCYYFNLRKNLIYIFVSLAFIIGGVGYGANLSDFSIFLLFL